jgi:uncharacterized cupin superfamily protein
MPKVVDIEQDLNKLYFFQGRSMETTPAQESAAFTKLADYRDGGVFAGGFSGESSWERHQNGDELVHILDGSTRLTITPQPTDHTTVDDPGTLE